ncbi:hypothetical protein AVEN_140669-1 [Araneus ventricosus]|uniref:Tc1-like transposase DDE domain-containing protein n=1 Tax=Araneus ventricosus TaxID=182803 RepID=A0A4Y2C477_ARAVE|nr:hypothetical protein AVEN_140669-1 [Araneus ventricosus]
MTSFLYANRQLMSNEEPFSFVKRPDSDGRPLWMYIGTSNSDIIKGVIFQQDGDPPQYGNIVLEFLDKTFPQRWIGRGAVMAWPPRSPAITPLDFYLWGYVKQHVYSERITDINHLKQRITDVIHSVTPIVLTRMWEELDYRLDVCRAKNGAHIELR